jgi:hypothetical protein
LNKIGQQIKIKKLDFKKYKTFVLSKPWLKQRDGDVAQWWRAYLAPKSLNSILYTAKKKKESRPTLAF